MCPYKNHSKRRKRGSFSNFERCFIILMFSVPFTIYILRAPLRVQFVNEVESSVLPTSSHRNFPVPTREADQEIYWEKEQARRRAQIQMGCEKGSKYYRKSFKLILNRKRSRYFLIVNDHFKVIFCYIPKVACTNLKKIMMGLAGRKNPLEISHTEAHLGESHIFLSDDQFEREEVLFRLQNYTKFMFVRHPMERVVSAFRNKLETSEFNYFKKIYGAQILSLFRKNADKETIERGEGVTFNEFMAFLMMPGPLGLNYRAIDEHWNRYVDICSPCSINYDYIGKYETMKDDINNILNKIQAPKDLKFPKFEFSQTSNLVKNYFDTVDARIKEKYFDFYNDDFLLFGYNKTRY